MTGAPSATLRDQDARELYPDNPVLARLWRGSFIESQHRGAWALVDTSGAVIAQGGQADRPVFARSSVKSLQALPLIESGAAERFGYSDEELALALSSHNAEADHTERVAAVLSRLGLGPAHLLCGPQSPGDPRVRAELERRGEKPSALHNNCSGKHAGFLCLAKHLGVAPEAYLDPNSLVQRRAREAMEEMSGVRPGEFSTAIDGCSAPTYRLPLTRLATAIARVANPEGLAAPRRQACERMLRAAAAHPELIAGRHRRLCTDLARVSAGRLFPKIGGEAVYVVGVRRAGVGLAVKIDDGETRALHALVLHLLHHFGHLPTAELERLGSWRAGPIRNWAGIEVGRMDVTP